MDDDRSPFPPRPDGRGDHAPHGAYGPPPWAPPPPWQAERVAEGRSHAETALILGILGLVVLPVLAPFAIWQAGKAEKLGVPATAGRVLGWVGTVLLGVVVVFFVLALAGLALVAGAGG